MKDLLQKSNFAIVGAGKRGRRFLEFFLRPDLGQLNIRIVGVADTNPAAEGFGGWAWGSKFADLNNDGWQDLYVANGYISQPDKDDL